MISQEPIAAASGLPIVSRDFAHPEDGWYHIEAKGEFPNLDANVVQVIDDAAISAIVSQFKQEAARPNFAGLLIDHEHFQHQLDKESIAYGWLTELGIRPDGIYGRIRWTTTGQSAVDGGDYRFFSTEYTTQDSVILNPGQTPRRIRPQRLSGLTLTNSSNNKGAKPITNRTSVGSATMKAVAQILGLSMEANESAIRDAINVLNRRVGKAEGELSNVRAQLKQANDRNIANQTSRIDEALQALNAEPIRNRVTAAQRGVFRKNLETDFEVGKMMLEGYVDGLTSRMAAGSLQATTSPITNRSMARTPSGCHSDLDDHSKSLIFNRKVLEYKAANRVSHAEADRSVADLYPELLPSHPRSIA